MMTKLGTPPLKLWETVWASTPEKSVELQNSYQGSCRLYPDGRMELRSDREGSWVMPYQAWLALLEEAREVARFYYGDGWGVEERRP